MFNDGMAMEVDASGGYHILMNLYTANGTEIKYAYSSNGTAWTYTSIDNSNNQTNYSYSNLQMKLDSSNRPHVYYLIKNIGTAGISSRVYTIIHKYSNGSSWVSETAYTQTGANELSMMSASLDSNNKSHIGFVAETNGIPNFSQNSAHDCATFLFQMMFGIILLINPKSSSPNCKTQFLCIGSV